MKQQIYIAPQTAVEPLQAEDELLTASKEYSGELGVRFIDEEFVME